MGNLKFQRVDWDDLMYVAFSNDGQELKWYPKWEDLSNIFDSAFATEDGLNEGVLTDYLLFTCLKILTRALLIRSHVTGIYEYNRLSDKLDKQLLRVLPLNRPRK